MFVASNKTFLGAEDSSLVPSKADLKGLESHGFIKLPVPNAEPCYGLLGDGTTGLYSSKSFWLILCR